jgi:LysM repeat protein
MLRFRAVALYTALFLLVSGLMGCVQGDNHADEEKDPHFQRGRDLAGGQDFKGAAEEFEKALEINPRSAPAHFELGWLYDTKLNDYAAAIYHYEQHLRLQPDSPRAPLVRERIRGCQQELANAEFPLPNSRNLQKDVDRLTTENTSLKQQIEDLKKQLAADADALAQNRVAAPVQRYAEVTPTAGATRMPPSDTSRPHQHIVKAHETISSIAAEYRMKPSAILAANPQTDPRRLRIGQSLNLP